MDKGTATEERIFYDGRCGLCHRAVRWVARREPLAFRFAPLGGASFVALVPPEQRADLPDSLVVWSADGRLLSRSAAILHILRRLGGGWTILARGAAWIPTALLDRGYDWVARVRYRWFAAPRQSCPVVPERLRQRFDP